MKCPECGSEVGPEERFCGNCGAPIEREQIEPEPAEPSLTEETMLVPAPSLLEEKVDDPAEETPSGEPGYTAGPPPPPGVEDAVPTPPEQDIVPPPAQEEIVPLAPVEELSVPPPTEEPLPSAVSTTKTFTVPPASASRTQDRRWIWILVAIVVVILAVCCCALLVVLFLFSFETNSTSMFLGQAVPLL